MLTSLASHGVQEGSTPSRGSESLKKNKVMKAVVKINDKWHIAENVVISYDPDLLKLEVKEVNFGVFILPYLEDGVINGVYRLENGLLLVEVPLSNVSGIQRSDI